MLDVGLARGLAIVPCAQPSLYVGLGLLLGLGVRLGLNVCLDF